MAVMETMYQKLSPIVDDDVQSKCVGMPIIIGSIRMKEKCSLSLWIDESILIASRNAHAAIFVDENL